MSGQLIAATNTIIPEESSIEAIDGESASNNGLDLKAEDLLRERRDRQKVARYFRFVETVEETKLVDKQRSNCNKPSFIKDYDGEQSDWTENHFFFNDEKWKESDEFRILFTSYQVKKMLANASKAGLCPEEIPMKLNEQKENASSFYYVKANKPTDVVHVPSIPEEGKVREFLEGVRTENPGCFEQDCRLEDVLEQLSEEDLKQSEDVLKQRYEQEFKSRDKGRKLKEDPSLPFDKKYDEVSCLFKRHHKGLVHQNVMKMCKMLYDFQGDLDEKTYEIRLGLGHVRMVYCKGDSEKRKILNAPLLEVPVKIDNDSLEVIPVKGGRLKWNGETKTALLCIGAKNKNKQVFSEFLSLLGNGEPTEFFLGDPTTFLKYVEAAAKFRFCSKVKNPMDPDLHQIPEGEDDEFVLTTEWCLFVRPKRSNSISNDALAFAKAFEETSLNLSLPCRSLLLGSSKSYSKKDTLNNSNFHLPLPASQNQQEIIERVYSDDNFVTLIRGPPGAGKTQTGLNIASIILQRGGKCLITSDNPRALEAFEQKLPEELSSFCINMSTMEEDGVGKLSEAFDTTENEILARYEEREYCKEKMEKLERDIADVEKDKKKQHDALEKRSSTSRGLMEKLEFTNAVKRSLQGDSASCRHIKHILKHDDLDCLREDLQNLFDNQRAEKEEPIPFEYNNSEQITQSLIEYVELKARPPDKPKERYLVPPKERRLVIPSLQKNEYFRLGTAHTVPRTPEDWARVARGLKAMKGESDFREVHLNSLVKRGCPEAIIYDDDGVVRQSFIDIVARLCESLKGVSQEDLEQLLLFIEDAKANRKLQKSQRDFSLRIQRLNVELIQATTAHSESTSITDNDLGNFSQLKELASRMKDSEIDASKPSAATKRRQKTFRQKFQKSLPCMRLLLMTTEQVSRYLPLDYRFELVIADEASQSPSSAALPILARAEKAVIIGDTKQILPKDDLTEDARSALEKCQGELDLADLFMPGDGNNLFDLCLSKFAVNQKLLRDHFRCPGNALSWQNNKMYANGMRFVMPSRSKPTQEVRYFNNANDAKMEMVQYVHDMVEKTLSSDTDGRKFPTIGIIMTGTGAKKDSTAMKGMIEEKLTDLENRYGPEEVDRFLIKVATPNEFQGQEKDIILIGCVPENNKAPKENTPVYSRMWNTTTSRFKKKTIIFCGYKKDLIKKDDPKHGIFMKYERSQLYDNVGYVKKENYDIKSMAEDKLVDELRSRGYEACRNKASLWENALSIELKDGSSCDPSALIAIENYGENLQEWRKVVREQADLEAGGVACLRVDALAFSLCFEAVFDDIKSFLKEEAGLHPTIQTTDELIVSPNSDGNQSASTEQRKRPPTKSLTKTSKRTKKH